MKLGAAAGLLVVILSVAGCQGQPPEPSSDNGPGPYVPITQQTQLQHPQLEPGSATACERQALAAGTVEGSNGYLTLVRSCEDGIDPSEENLRDQGQDYVGSADDAG